MSHIGYNPKAQAKLERAALAARAVAYVPPRPIWFDALAVALVGFTFVLVLL
jgi:hypothetical protein